MKTILTLTIAAWAAAFVRPVTAETISLETAPPVVAKTVPVAGAADADPGLTELRVTYSKPMRDGSWSWSTWGQEYYPETTGKPRYLADRRTCVLPVKLNPGKFYAIWLNSGKFKNFKDASGRAAVPYLLTFTTAAKTAGGADPSPLPSAEDLPGKLVFHGRYQHRSRGRDITTPSELWLKKTEDGGLAALASLPWMGTRELATGDAANQVTNYRIRGDAAGGRPGYQTDLKLRDGGALFTRRGIRQDVTNKELKIPDGARFDPNTRPDPYCAANILLRSFALKPDETRRFHMVDWDNAGEGLVDYTIEIRHAGKERVEVPAGTFEANHLVLTQLTSADTWFKKRAGHVTDFWVSDNQVIVRVLRHREPYEMVLLDFTVPDQLDATAPAGSETDTSKKTAPPAGMLSFGPVIERVVTEEIDLDSGSLKPEELSGDDHRADALYEDPVFVFSVSTDRIRLAGNDWTKLTPGQLKTALEKRLNPSDNPFNKNDATLPVTLGFRTRSGRMGLLQITGFTDKPRGVKIRYKLVQDAGDPSPVTPPAGSRLEFRIAPSPSALDKAELSSCMEWLKAGRVGFWWKNGRISGIGGRMPNHAWLPIAGELGNAGQLVTGESRGRKYVLVSDQPGETLLPDEGKGVGVLAKVYATTENSGRPAVGFVLDDRGAERLSALTKANIGNALAIVVDGKVVSAPVLMSELGRQGMITGLFTEQEVEDMVKALEAGVPAAPQLSDAGGGDGQIESRPGEAEDADAAIEVGKGESVVRSVQLPDADTEGVPKVLDLASGKLLKVPVEGERNIIDHFNKLGQGDLAWDDALSTLRGARVHEWKNGVWKLLEPGREAMGSRIYRLALPKHLLVTTAGGNRYAVTVSAGTGDGVVIRYHREDVAAPPKASDDEKHVRPDAPSNDGAGNSTEGVLVEP